jgi:hypothetical protein
MPGFRKIGFPDTQQTKDINQRAREIRAAKMKSVEEDSRQVSLWFVSGREMLSLIRWPECSKADGRYRKKR